MPASIKSLMETTGKKAAKWLAAAMGMSNKSGMNRVYSVDVVQDDGERVPALMAYNHFSLHLLRDDEANQTGRECDPQAGEGQTPDLSMAFAALSPRHNEQMIALSFSPNRLREALEGMDDHRSVTIDIPVYTDKGGRIRVRRDGVTTFAAYGTVEDRPALAIISGRAVPKERPWRPAGIEYVRSSSE